MLESEKLYKRKRKLRFFIAFRKASWVFYGGFLIWMIFELDSGPLAWVLAFIAVIIAEAGLVDLDLAIELEKEALKDEYKDELDWL